MPLWLKQAVALIIKYGKRVPWSTIWKVVVAIAAVKPTIERNLSERERGEFYRLLHKARTGQNKRQPWRNLSERERRRLWELAQKAAGYRKAS